MTQENQTGLRGFAENAGLQPAHESTGRGSRPALWDLQGLER